MALPVNHRKPGLRYRICRVCGQKWNISVCAARNKVYICLLCERRREFTGKRVRCQNGEL